MYVLATCMPRKPDLPRKRDTQAAPGRVLEHGTSGTELATVTRRRQSDKRQAPGCQRRQWPGEKL